jgi:hypothetical protein
MAYMYLQVDAIYTDFSKEERGAFILFINDVFSCFKSLLLYADDLKICFPVAGNSDFANAQAELDVFLQWCTDSRMQLNLGKCKSISFTRSRLTKHFQYEHRGHRLNSVDSICALGVFLDSKLNFTSHIDSMVVKASRMLGYIRRIGKEFRDPYTLKTLNNSFVWSHLDYASVM